MELLSIVVFVLWICGYVLWVCRSSLWVCRSIDFVLQESKFSVWSLYFSRNQSRPPPTLARSDSTSGFLWLAAGLELLHSFKSSWLLVGHKLDPWTALGSGIFQVGSENFDPVLPCLHTTGVTSTKGKYFKFHRVSWWWKHHFVYRWWKAAHR